MVKPEGAMEASNGVPLIMQDSGERRLLELGYKQELRREMVMRQTPLFHSLFFFPLVMVS